MGCKLCYVCMFVLSIFCVQLMLLLGHFFLFTLGVACMCWAVLARHHINACVFHVW